MAFNVNAFRSTLNSHNGLVPTNAFVMQITEPEWVRKAANSGNEENTDADAPNAPLKQTINIADQRDLVMFCDSATVPSKSLDTIDYRPQGFGAVSKIPYGMTQEPLTCSFMLDSDHKVNRFFQMWMQEIVNTGSAFGGPLSTYKDRTDHEIAYKSSYVSTIILTMFAKDSTSIEYHFQNAYPTQLGGIAMSWDNNDQFARMPVEFTYETVSVFKNELPLETFSSRGNNLFQQIARLGTIAGVINNIRKPRNIQDAINQVANVQTLLNNI